MGSPQGVMSDTGVLGKPTRTRACARVSLGLQSLTDGQERATEISQVFGGLEWGRGGRTVGAEWARSVGGLALRHHGGRWGRDEELVELGAEDVGLSSCSRGPSCKPMSSVPRSLFSVPVTHSVRSLESFKQVFLWKLPSYPICRTQSVLCCALS